MVSALIVNFNSSALLRDCLQALMQSSIAHQIETIVVDNASDDFDLAAMTNEYPDIQWLPQRTNTTCTGGNNIAFRHANADLILMLNPDTRVEPPAIERAVQRIQQRPDLVAVGAYFVGPDGHLQRYYRRLPSLADLPVMLFEPIFRNSRRGRRFLMSDESFEGETLVPHVAGVFLLMRRGALASKLFESNYYNLLSDLDLSRRLNRMGRVAVFSDIRCFHLGGGGGLATPDPVVRLRLYQDFTWGLRRYFGPQLGPVGRMILNLWLMAYWITRVGRQRPRLLARAIESGVSALLGRPPHY